MTEIHHKVLRCSVLNRDRPFPLDVLVVIQRKGDEIPTIRKVCCEHYTKKCHDTPECKITYHKCIFNNDY